MNTWIVCIDGTSNSPGQMGYDRETNKKEVAPTNVVRTWEALTGEKLPKGEFSVVANLKFQPGKAIYICGVGTDGLRIAEVFQQATGHGTSQRVLTGYKFLAEHWCVGDDIFGFGFSRGAFAIRSLFGFIEMVGLPCKPGNLEDIEIDELYSHYKKETPDYTKRSNFKECNPKFLGLWDTVVTIPFDRTIYNFHQVNPKNVSHVFHALALDEIRSQFLPTYFDGAKEQHVEEVWFAGVHSNVGGGYCDTDLSSIAHFWILNKAVNCGLNLHLLGIDGYQSEDARGRIEVSYEDFWNKIPLVGQFVQAIDHFQKERAVSSHHKLHQSVRDVMDYQKDANIQDKYVPKASNWESIAIEQWNFPIEIR